MLGLIENSSIIIMIMILFVLYFFNFIYGMVVLFIYLKIRVIIYLCDWIFVFYICRIMLLIKSVFSNYFVKYYLVVWKCYFGIIFLYKLLSFIM